MPWNDNANPGPWGAPSGGDGDRKDPPKRPQGGGPRGPRGPGGPGGPDRKEVFERLQHRLGDLFGGPGGNIKPGALVAIGAGAVGLWALSGFYIIQPSERGVVLTFGAFSRISGPGPNYRLPFPIEKVEKVSVTSLRRTDVGGQGEGDAPKESQMLTGDEQIIDLDFSITWRVADPKAYLFATRAPDDAVKAVAESAMREVVGKTPLQPIISTGRGQVQLQTADLMQRTLDSWKSGITIVEVQIRSANPPPEVVSAFRAVTNAEQDAAGAINEANTYRNRVINEAKGDASKVLQASEGYREQAVRDAQGEAARFNQIHAEYRRAPGVTRDRLYIESMERILARSNKVVIDAKGASAPIILPPDVFRSRAVPTPQPQVEVGPPQAAGKAAQ